MAPIASVQRWVHDEVTKLPTGWVALAGVGALACFRALIGAVAALRPPPRSPSASEESRQSSAVTASAIIPGAEDAALAELRHNVSGPGMSISKAAQQLRAIIHLVDSHQHALVAAMHADLGQPEGEIILQLLDVRRWAVTALKCIRSWNAPERDRSFSPLVWPSRKGVVYEPRGIVLITAAWNAPITLALKPAVSALAARNACILKINFDASPTVARLFEKLIPTVFDPHFVKVVSMQYATDKAAMDALIDNPSTKVDKLLFVGSTAVGRMLYEQASKHFIDVCLELGGQNPALISHDADLAVAARHIVLGRMFACGQACFAPNTIYVEEQASDAMKRQLVHVLEHFFGRQENGAYRSNAQIASGRTKRVQELLSQTTGKILAGGEVNLDHRRVEPTIVEVENDSDVLMQEEIFAPIVVIKRVQSVDAIIDSIAGADARPLVASIWTRNRHLKTKFMAHVRAGGIVVNGNPAFSYIANVPFGGNGSSGLGKQHGLHGIREFQHAKGTVEKIRSPLLPSFVHDPPLLFPPYTASKMRFLNFSRFL